MCKLVYNKPTVLQTNSFFGESINYFLQFLTKKTNLYVDIQKP